LFWTINTRRNPHTFLPVQALAPATVKKRLWFARCYFRRNRKRLPRPFADMYAKAKVRAEADVRRARRMIGG
jgi:hypothetical protein